MYKRMGAIKAALLFALLFFSITPEFFADSRIMFSDPSILNDGQVDISQRWDYYKSAIIEPDKFYPTIQELSGSIVNFPHALKDGVSLATYHLRLTGLVPHKRYSSDFYGALMTSSRIWCNGKIVATGGFLSKDKLLGKPGDIFAPVDFQADKNGIADIVIHVANNQKCVGGVAKKISVTSSDNIRKRYYIHYLLNAFIFAFVIAHVIYNMILSALNFRQISYITLILTFILYAAAVALTGYSLPLQRGLAIPFWLHRKLAVLILCFVTPLELLYVMGAHKTSLKKEAAILSAAAANALVALALPLDIFEKTRWIHIVLAIFFYMIRLAIPFRFVLKRNLDNKKIFHISTVAYNFSAFVTLLVFFCRVNDFLIMPQKYTAIHSFLFFKLSILLFGISQCGLYAYHRDYSTIRVSRQMEKLSFTNNTLAKIVPPQVLKLMGANDITKIIPGESRIIDAILFYVQIKHFNRLAESIGKDELYSIQTDFFQAISPIIIDSGGFVAKYSISGCLAIFQEKNSDAIICASRLQRKMREIRRMLRKTKRNDISVGIAIHAGKVAVGTIGSNTRLDTMALSEDVKITYAVGGQTSKTNTQILITEEAMPYCRSYINYVYEGHYFISGGKQILVYNALPIKKNEQAFEDTLEPVEEEDEL